MSQRRLPPPDPPACLLRLRPSSQKGGTLIAEAVTERAEHERRVRDPDGYRPAFCANCNGTVLHVHDYRERQLRAEPGRPVATVVRHVCVACEAVWQTLPAFVARHLWRSWAVVERALAGTVSASPGPESRVGPWPRVRERTRRRWRARWRATALFLVRVLAASGEEAWAALARRLGLDATRGELVAAYAASTSTPPGQRLAAVSALVYRLQPKVRLM
jgi:hypothetical protein